MAHGVESQDHPLKSDKAPSTKFTSPPTPLPFERIPIEETASYVDPETVRESSIFIYKDYVDTDDNGDKVLKTHPTWRCGPDMKDPR